MPSPSLTATSSQELTLKPSVRKRLLVELNTYAGLRAELKAIEARMDKSKAIVETIREETGEQKLEIDGYSICIVAPIRKKFSPKKYVLIGGDLALYNLAMEDVTSKPYTKVTCPGAKEEE